MGGDHFLNFNLSLCPRNYLHVLAVICSFIISILLTAQYCVKLMDSHTNTVNI